MLEALTAIIRRIYAEPKNKPLSECNKLLNSTVLIYLIIFRKVNFLKSGDSKLCIKSFNLITFI